MKCTLIKLILLTAILLPLKQFAQTTISGSLKTSNTSYSSNNIPAQKKSTINIPGLQIIPGTIMDSTKLLAQPSVTDGYQEIFFLQADPATQKAWSARFYHSLEQNNRHDSAIRINCDPPGPQSTMYGHPKENIYPWINGEGSRLYWSHNSGGGPRIVMSQRDTNTGQFPTFTDIEFLSFVYRDIWLVSTWFSSDELTMYVSTSIPRNDSVSRLYTLTRPSISQRFLADTSQQINFTGLNLTGFFSAPSLTPDKNELFIWSLAKEDSCTLLRFEKTGTNTFDFKRQYHVALPYLLQQGQLSKDGLRLYFSVQDTNTNLSNIYYIERQGLNSDFVLEAKEFTPEITTTLLNIFPVPSSNVIHVECRSNKDHLVSFELLTSSGENILKQQFNTNNKYWSFNVSHLPEGVYCYRIFTNSGMQDGKLVVR